MSACTHILRSSLTCRVAPMQLLWKYAKKSVALRVRYFTTLPKGVASHTVLVQDIPGVPFGTQVQRVESVAPKFIASKARGTVNPCSWLRLWSQLCSYRNMCILGRRLGHRYIVMCWTPPFAYGVPLPCVNNLQCHSHCFSTASGSSIRTLRRPQAACLSVVQVHAGVAKSASMAERGMSTTTDKALKCAAPLSSWHPLTSPLAAATQCRGADLLRLRG